ncbi:hypothetical protein KPL71_008370 [Citrus sinensis]|uniref:Uncharacterized protein n=1 Tax=Citrus sinensis TaxID=2711 RepID=A0ACB8M5Z5_CITSI|nr:hypothetical protein KPL71_008370 [Citrus sinensis]
MNKKVRQDWHVGCGVTANVCYETSVGSARHYTQPTHATSYKCAGAKHAHKLSWTECEIAQGSNAKACMGSTYASSTTLLLAQPTDVQPTPMLRLTHLTTNSLSLRRPFAFDPAVVASIFAIASDCFQSIFATSRAKVISVVRTIAIRSKVVSVGGTIWYQSSCYKTKDYLKPEMLNALVKETEGDSLKLSAAKLDATRINPLRLLNNMDVEVKEIGTCVRNDRYVAFQFDPEIERTVRRLQREQRNSNTVSSMNNLQDAGNLNPHGPLQPINIQEEQNEHANERQAGNNNIIYMADDKDIAIKDYVVLTPQVVHPGIIRPEVEVANFELKPVMFQMLQTVGQFNGLPNEDPHLYLKLFLEVSDTFKITGATQDALRLRLFSYSLRDRARAWLNLLPSDSITIWNELADKFLMKYFPPKKNAKLQNEITFFHQLENESLYETWERFKELLRRCPHHGIPCCIQLETFYNGLNPSTRQPAARGPAWVHNIDAITALSAQVTSLTNMVKAMTSAPTTVKQVAKISCVYCGEEHDFDNCLGNPASVNYVGNFNRQPQNNPYSNTYNSGWKQHPNFSWSSQNRNAPALNGQNRNLQPPGFHQQSQGQKHISQDPITSLEVLIKEYIAKNEAIVQSQAVSLRNLENQMGQLATTMSSKTQESLPSNTEDPKRESKEHCKVINLRSGKNVDTPVDVTKNEMKFNSAQKPPQNGSMLQQAPHQDTGYMSQATATAEEIQPEQVEKEVATPVATAYTKPNKQSLIPPEATQQFRHPPPFPQRFQKQNQDKQFSKFLEVLKQLHINIPFVEALDQMSNYVKFLKDILARKRRLGEFETVALTQESSHLLQSKIPTKVKDLGSFTIPCSIGTRYAGRALCDLGASINLMPLFVFKQLRVWECRPTTVSLQLADRSHAYTEGKIEDVLVKVDKFIFPVEFIVLDFEANK